MLSGGVFLLFDVVHGLVGLDVDWFMGSWIHVDGLMGCWVDGFIGGLLGSLVYGFMGSWFEGFMG